MILVTGAAGLSGSFVVRELRQRGLAVRGLVRAASVPAAQALKADLTVAETLSRDATSDFTHSRAVVIGINACGDDIPRLTTVVNDATRLAEAITQDSARVRQGTDEIKKQSSAFIRARPRPIFRSVRSITAYRNVDLPEVNS